MGFKNSRGWRDQPRRGHNAVAEPGLGERIDYAALVRRLAAETGTAKASKLGFART